MEQVNFGQWRILGDRVLTRRAYAAGTGAVDLCGCATCRNFASARRQVYPPPVLSLLDRLGIDPAREAQVYHLGRLKPGLHLYTGWFHFVGYLPDSDCLPTSTRDSLGLPFFEVVTDDFNLWFTPHVTGVPPAFRGYPVVQLEFSADVPWVLGAPEPI